ncbi:hypothetical protein OSTOST_13474 [Ostertagia ostertagi]
MDQEERDAAIGGALGQFVVQQGELAGRTRETFRTVRAGADDEKLRRVGGSQQRGVGADFFSRRALQRMDVMPDGGAGRGRGFQETLAGLAGPEGAADHRQEPGLAGIERDGGQLGFGKGYLAMQATGDRLAHGVAEERHHRDARAVAPQDEVQPVELSGMRQGVVGEGDVALPGVRDLGVGELRQSLDERLVQELRAEFGGDLGKAGAAAEDHALSVGLSRHHGPRHGDGRRRTAGGLAACGEQDPGGAGARDRLPAVHAHQAPAGADKRSAAAGTGGDAALSQPRTRHRSRARDPRAPGRRPADLFDAGTGPLGAARRHGDLHEAPRQGAHRFSRPQLDLHQPEDGRPADRSRLLDDAVRASLDGHGGVEPGGCRLRAAARPSPGEAQVDPAGRSPRRALPVFPAGRADAASDRCGLRAGADRAEAADRRLFLGRCLRPGRARPRRVDRRALHRARLSQRRHRRRAVRAAHPLPVPRHAPALPQAVAAGRRLPRHDEGASQSQRMGIAH